RSAWGGGAGFVVLPPVAEPVRADLVVPVAGDADHSLVVAQRLAVVGHRWDPCACCLVAVYPAGLGLSGRQWPGASGMRRTARSSRQVRVSWRRGRSNPLSAPAARRDPGPRRPA